MVDSHYTHFLFLCLDGKTPFLFWTPPNDVYFLWCNSFVFIEKHLMLYWHESKYVTDTSDINVAWFITPWLLLLHLAHTNSFLPQLHTCGYMLTSFGVVSLNRKKKRKAKEKHEHSPPKKQTDVFLPASFYSKLS